MVTLSRLPRQDKKQEEHEQKQDEKPKAGKGVRGLPARSPRRGLFIQQCRVMHYS
jgi:hypothetical protein